MWGIILGVLLVTGLFSGVGVPIWLMPPWEQRDLSSHATPLLMHFRHSNLTTEDLKALDRMTASVENDTTVFRNSNGEFWGTGEVGHPIAKGGIAHGKLSISMSSSDIPVVEHGRWVSVDTREESEASARTVEAFKRLLERSGIMSDEVDADDDVRHMINVLDQITEEA